MQWLFIKEKEFKDWNGDALITSLKDKSLREDLSLKVIILLNEEIIFKGNIGRIRDIKIQQSNRRNIFTC